MFGLRNGALIAYMIIVLTAGLVVGSCKRAEANEIVYQTIAMEAAGESLEGQAMVARVIINRAKASNRSMEAICLAPKQFSCWNDRKWAKRWLSRHYDSNTRLRAVKAYQGAVIASTAYADVRHYHVKGISPRWARGRKPTLIIGQHVFYAGIR